MAAAGDYFPKDSVSAFEQKWFGKHLTVMREPVIEPSSSPEGDFSFRILYLPTWGRPVSVRYWNNGTNYFRRSVMLSGDGGYDPGVIKKESQTEVYKQEVDQLMANLDKIQFWRIPTKDSVLGFDGSELIMEGVRGKEHKLVVRWSPDYQSKQRELETTVSFYKGLFQQLGLVEKPLGVGSEEHK